MGEATWAQQAAAGVGSRAAAQQEGDKTPTLIVDRRMVVWMKGPPQEIKPEGFPTADGKTIWVGRLLDAYDDPRRPSERPNQAVVDHAYVNFRALIQAMACKPGTRAFDSLVTNGLPEVIVDAPPVYKSHSIAGYGVKVPYGGIDGKQKGVAYLFFGACAMRERDRREFQRALGRVGYPTGRA